MGGHTSVARQTAAVTSRMRDLRREKVSRDEKVAPICAGRIRERATLVQMNEGCGAPRRYFAAEFQEQAGYTYEPEKVATRPRRLKKATACVVLLGDTHCMRVILLGVVAHPESA